MGGGPVYAEEEEESDDELLLTTEAANKFEEVVQTECSLAKTSPTQKHSPQFHTFLANHPQANTHEVRLVDEVDALVPNFIGGPLPRKDAGSREEYCMTMLTLFRPWRTGKDLRPGENVMWSEVYDNYNFTERQRSIMKFFHIKYECHDARNDFSAKRNQGKQGKHNPLYMSDHELNEIEMDGIIFDGEAVPENRENELINSNDWNSISRGEVLRQTRMETAENVMKSSGWLDPMTAQQQSAIRLSKLKVQVTPDQECTPTEWKSIL
ncbi:hypothetical protein L226DRAFT_474580, partial [Lentinus tigrinus ALCF2SS1-7]|uniref:uncharacterized protein n=1 Tax=Lentinus tigrinus ALCF2SS1-7 TaxID=1328758 RepID=UPI001165E097